MHVRRLEAVVVLLALFGTTRCAYHESSPGEWGFFVKAAPGFPVGGGELTVHPMASYTRLFFEGGRDDLFELGGQVRHPIPVLGSTLPDFWLGVEAAGSRLRTSFDNDVAPAYSNNGWSITALAGTPVTNSKWGINIFAGAGISNYGGQGYNARLGLDFQPWFLRR